MKLVGLTGGIGSGKSTVAGMFRTLGIPVYESDASARILMNEDPDVRERITDLFGKEAYQADGTLDRAWVASQVFSQRELLEKLNAIVHPAVYLDLKKWAAQPDQVNAPYLLQESAILIEEHLTDRLDAIILVVADEQIRIDRVVKRDQSDPESVRQRMRHQWPDAEKIPLADYVIYNDGDRSLIEQVTDIHKMILDRL